MSGPIKMVLSGPLPSRENATKPKLDVTNYDVVLCACSIWQKYCLVSHTRRHTIGPLSRLFQMPQRNITIPTQSVDNFYGFFLNSFKIKAPKTHNLMLCSKCNFLYEGLVTMGHNQLVIYSWIFRKCGQCDKHL